MTRLDARLLVGLRGPDLVATTARLALVHKMGFGDRLAGLERYDFFHLEIESAAPPEATIDALRKALARQSTFYNRNKHMYSLDCRWDGELRTDGPTHEALKHRFGQIVGRIGGGNEPKSGTGIDFDGKRGSRVATVKEYPAFLVEVSVEDDDSAGRDAIAARLTGELSGMLGGTIRVRCPSRATVWWLGIAAPDEAAALETARQITVTKRRDAGLLMNPNYQRAEFVSAGRIEPVTS
ncbi:MAG: hypothetical protein OEX18_04575 [Candidatus Krumholzibacteria bacterium]|nr:hypothetical protein [Candidatus Krumholzibacteria bacterium]MDH4336534.1 hypothetical protein [Candidatus Krumholzibacteria bacterium]MDH5269615.1 hypothetical protein [Candidatus Krumholzibacteria bacterium]